METIERLIPAHGRCHGEHYCIRFPGVALAADAAERMCVSRLGISERGNAENGMDAARERDEGMREAKG